MHYGIIAAGNGSRLCQEGVAVPKPMVALEGEPMIGRLVRLMADTAAESITVLLNPEFQVTEQYLRNIKIDVPLKVVTEATPSSLHTCALLSRQMPPGRCVVSTVDSVFRAPAFERYVQAWTEAPEQIDAMMAVTSLVDDERPLWVDVDGDGTVRGFADDHPADCLWVSAGIYGLGPASRRLLQECVDIGISRMRNYQRQLLAHGLRVTAFDIGRVIDVDHAADIEKAEQLLKDR